MSDIDAIPKLVRELYAVVDKLERAFPGRRFTPDGHLVGSIGEVLAAHHYDLELLGASTQGHDARSTDGRLVQVKVTQTGRVAISSEPEHLVVLRITRLGGDEEIYNGPGELPWKHAGKLQRNGQRPISLSKLEALMADVPPSKKLPRTRS